MSEQATRGGIQRFNATVGTDKDPKTKEPYSYPSMKADPEGGWVQWEDVEREFVPITEHVAVQLRLTECEEALTLVEEAAKEAQSQLAGHRMVDKLVRTLNADEEEDR